MSVLGVLVSLLWFALVCLTLCFTVSIPVTVLTVAVSLRPFLFLQAFLDDHVELRQSASFGDVSAMVEQWMSLEENNDEEHLEDAGMGGAFSF